MKETAEKFVEEFAREKGLSLDEAERELCESHRKKPLTKLLDEYNWLKATRRLDQLRGIGRSKGREISLESSTI